MRESSLKQKTSTWGLNHISQNNASGISLHLLSIVTVIVPLQEWLLIGSEKPYKIVLWLLSLITLFTEHTRHKMLLDYRGFKTKVVENGQEAVDMFIAGNYFDVVFMDMEMPVMDGIQATKKLRAMDVKSLIYGVTASESKTEIQAFIEAGLDECFQKPLTAVVIDSVVKRLNLEY